MSAKMKTALLSVGIAITLAGCGKSEPKGQVVATINGTEVTQQELNAELASANVPDSADKKQVQRALLQRIVDRKLLAQEASKRGLDKTAEYLGQKLRADETLLAQQFVRQQVSTLPQPTAADLSKFMADNPTAFAQRAQLRVDQIRFAMPKDPNVLQSLRDLHTNDAVAGALKAKGVSFERGTSVIDTAQLPPQVAKQIEGLPAGEPFVLPAQGLILVNVVTGKQAVAIPDAQARQIAANGWREKQFGTLLGDKVAQLRKEAKITYQPGFEPPAEKGGAATAGAGTPAAATKP